MQSMGGQLVSAIIEFTTPHDTQKNPTQISNLNIWNHGKRDGEYSGKIGEECVIVKVNSIYMGHEYTRAFQIKEKFGILISHNPPFT